MIAMLSLKNVGLLVILLFVVVCLLLISLNFLWLRALRKGNYTGLSVICEPRDMKDENQIIRGFVKSMPSDENGNCFDIREDDTRAICSIPSADWSVRLMPKEEVSLKWGILRSVVALFCLVALFIYLLA